MSHPAVILLVRFKSSLSLDEVMGVVMNSQLRRVSNTNNATKTNN